MSTLRQLLAALIPAQRTQLERRRLQQSAAVASAVMPRRATATPCPLSFAQQRLWFLHQLAPHSLFYNVAKALRLRGTLDVEALHHALHTIVARHEALRTTFPLADGLPVQVIAKDQPVDLEAIDLRTWPPAERGIEMQRLLTHKVQRPFDLSRDALLPPHYCGCMSRNTSFCSSSTTLPPTAGPQASCCPHIPKRARRSTSTPVAPVRHALSDGTQWNCQAERQGCI